MTTVFLTVPWVGLQCVSVVFADHTHLLFDTINLVWSISIEGSQVIISKNACLSLNTVVVFMKITKSVDRDEVSQYVEFHLSLRCLLKSLVYK